ncbi:hypothetical protein H8356DRAFT_1687557 [Neocallimastix lanati (nom. inval.)]|nr:hypothetical protein H8356DRAFT_1687557 [Neocallimastix sp. JGI-2020a]
MYCKVIKKIFLFYYHTIFFLNNIINCCKINFINNNNLIFINQSKLYNNNNLIKSNNFSENTCSKEKDDLSYILNYKGGIIEPEWQWVKNISIVYTWVDGSDINFQDLKSKYNGGIKNDNNRDRSVDELRYSIRSLEKYMPWHQGTIYIVTCHQIPKWLDVNNPRIKIIDHKTIFPKFLFPTFDSNIIELYLDKIPGITERFIYFNDDLFLNNYIHPSFFFTNKGYIKIYKENKLLQVSMKIFRSNILKKRNMFNNMSYNTRKMIRSYFNKDFQYYYLQHYPNVIYRDLMEPFRQFFKKDLKVFCIDKFRNWEKIHLLYLYFMFVKYSSSNTHILKLYKKFNSISNGSIINYSLVEVPISISTKLVKFGSITDNSKNNKKQFNYINTHPNIRVFNFNDDYSKHYPSLELLEFMMTRFPEPSSFEKKEYIELENQTYKKIMNLPIPNGFIYNKTQNSSNNKNTNLCTEISKTDILEDYIIKKEELQGPKKEISDREKEEIEFLLNYKGEKLDNEWEWAKTLSIVYIFENNENTKKIEMNKLKYSLRSIEKYLPWFKGNIYIIINNEDQKEFKWINSNNNIKLINQKYLIPNNNLFNRHIIEMFLDKIPGLSERFIYINNNNYFINYTHPRFFFNKEFFPKYNFEKILSNREVNEIKNSNNSFFSTYKIIFNYFGKHYVNGLQYYKNAPYPLYRDLFGPVRQLYKNFVKNLVNGKYSLNNSILPMYMITTYNIYGTNHPYFPNIIGGYGKAKKSKPIILNPLRKIEFYGFDITSPAISNKTMFLDISFKKEFNSLNVLNNINNCKYEAQKYFNKIISEQKLFFSLKEVEYSNFDCFLKIMNHLYNKKSLFEL